MKNFQKEYDTFIETYGFDSQILMCIEEMSELTKELCKYKILIESYLCFVSNRAIMRAISEDYLYVR